MTWRVVSLVVRSSGCGFNSRCLSFLSCSSSSNNDERRDETRQGTGLDLDPPRRQNERMRDEMKREIERERELDEIFLLL